MPYLLRVPHQIGHFNHAKLSASSRLRSELCEISVQKEKLDGQRNPHKHVHVNYQFFVVKSYYGKSTIIII